MFKACILDIDGTLLDSVESIGCMANRVLESYGLPAQPIADYNYYAGDGADELIKRALKAAGDTTLTNFKEAAVKYRKWFAEDPLYHVTAFAGMKETLQELKNRGIILGVCSNKPQLAAIGAIEGIFGKDCFAIIQGQEEGIPRKPSPEIAWMVAKKCGAKPEECMYVGDTDTDMMTGKAANMYTIGVTWGFRDREELEKNRADIIIDKPEQLLEIQAGELK